MTPYHLEERFDIEGYSFLKMTNSCVQVRREGRKEEEEMEIEGSFISGCEIVNRKKDWPKNYSMHQLFYS